MVMVMALAWCQVELRGAFEKAADAAGSGGANHTPRALPPSALAALAAVWQLHPEGGDGGPSS